MFISQNIMKEIKPLMMGYIVSTHDYDVIDAEDYQKLKVQQRNRKKRRVQPWTIFHVIMIFGYFSFWIIISRWYRDLHCDGRDLIYSPAREALHYQKQVFYSELEGNPFVGPPRPELEDAWHQLLKHMHIRLSREEMENVGGRSLELADGSGFVGSLEVYHDLHCLKRIRQYIYRDTYFANVTSKEWERHTFHTEHCLEHFRELVMCRGDIAMTTFYYRNHLKAAKLLAEHECVNWETLDEWSSRRAIDISTPGVLLSEEDSEHVENITALAAPSIL